MNTANSLPDFLNDLRKRAKGDLRTDEYSRILYSTDASIYQVMPHGVLIPAHTDDIHAAVELAARYHIPLLPRAGGSSLAGQAVNTALVIDTSRHINQVLEVNAEESWVRTEPGISLDELNIYLEPYGLKFGPDPASSNRAGMGGIVSNNSTGAHSILYGMTADHVLECKGILSDGSPFHFVPLESEMLRQRLGADSFESTIYRGIHKIATEQAGIIRSGTPKHWRRCGGYNLDRFVDSGVTFNFAEDRRFNLSRLICGAEGTLAVITELKLNLVPLPRKTALLLLQFNSLKEALTSVPTILEARPAAIELLDNLGLSLCKDVPEYARLLRTFLKGEPNCVLITEVYADNDVELQGQVDSLKSHLGKHAVKCECVEAFDPALQQNVWTVRKVGLGLLMSIKGDFKPLPFIEDAAVPPQHLAEYISRIERFCNDLGTRVAYYAHASAGCLHVRPLINAKLASDVKKLPEIAAFSAELVGGYGGSLSSEHGDGRSRSWLNERFYGKELFGLYREVKSLFDPQNIMNPGNIVKPQAMTDNLRYGEKYNAIELETALDFRSDQGFHRAVEMCNGAGVCRKLTTGTMCPSFMATREEEHSTRGRANALRAALSGSLPAEALTSKRMYEVMDLCIECKACKAECPSSVDMAKIKFEFLAQYHKANGIPLRARMFADIARMSRLFSGPLAVLINPLLHASLSARLMQRLLGISARRKMPSFARHSFIKQFARRGPANVSHKKTRRQVVLFNDTFNTYNDPHIAMTAVRLLEAAGCEIILPGHHCCGRPMISKGLVDKARAAALDVVNKLHPYVAQGIPVVGIEPSCLLSLRDEYAYLLPNDKRVGQIAENSFLIDEYMIQLAAKNQLSITFDSARRKALLHGHCHQKALTGTADTRRLLELAGYDVTEVDTSCCGMAGSFGYEAEHYYISVSMAERRLLPAVRESGEETVIVAMGTSCRHQILHGSGRVAVHPLEAVYSALTEEVLSQANS